MTTTAEDFFELLDTLQPEEPKPSTEVVVVDEQQLPDEVKAFSGIERKIIEHTLNGDSPDTISLRLALPVSSVRSILSKKDVKEFIRQLTIDMNEVEVARLKAIYGKMIDARIEEADGDMSKISRKDTLEVMKQLQDLLIAERKTAKTDEPQNVFVNILNQVM